MIDPYSYNTPPPVDNKRKNTMIIVITFIVVGLIFGGIYLMRKSDNTKQEEVKVEVTQEPTPTEAVEINKEDVTIQVLNGTGTPGQAGIVVQALKEADYNADNIKSANADEFDTTVTTISAKSGFESIVSDIEKILLETFDEVDIDSSELDADSEFDIIITTGGEKYEEATPTPTPTTSVTTAPTTTTTPTLTPTITPTPTP